MKKLLIGLLLTCSVAQAQQVNSETGNIVYTTLNPPPPGAPYTWTGFVNSNTGGGGLSGGNVPAYNPNTGTFIFGYAQGTVSYTTAINFALANAGTNIQVNGFKYSWEYFNQDYSRGTLSGNISLTNSSGAVVQSYGYNMPKTTQGWTPMSGIQNFNTQYAPATLGNLQVSFTGKDDRFWAGYYGPQIRAIDVRMLYSVAAPSTDFSQWIKLTDENGTFTLSKTGVVRYGAQGTYEYKTFQPGTYSCSNGAWGNDPIGGVYKACDLGSNTPPPSPLPTTTTNNNTTTTAAITEITTSAAQPTTTATTSPTGVETSTTNTGTTSSSLSSPSPTTSSQTTVATASNTSATTSAVASTTVSTPTSNNTRSVDGTGIGLSVVARNQQREQSIAMQASQTAVAAAEQTAQQSQQEAVSIAQASSTSSMNFAVSAAPKVESSALKTEQSNNQLTPTNNSVVAMLQAPQTVSSKANENNRINFASVIGQEVTQTQTASTSSTIREISNLLQPQVNFVPSVSQRQTTVSLSPTVAPTPVVTQEQTTVSQTQSNYTLLPPQQQTQQTISQMPLSFANENQQPIQLLSTTNQQTLFTTNETTNSDSQKFLTDKSNPINQILESKPEVQSSSSIQPKTTVNTNASDNEIAGGVALTRMATSPPGYSQYLNLVIADASFYAPKEIYKGQKNVDNVRALRSMSSDRLHQQMIDLQYERK